MHCCDDLGRILKPDKPLRATHDQLLEMAYGDGRGPKGEVWTTYSEVSVPGQACQYELRGSLVAEDMKIR